MGKAARPLALERDPTFWGATSWALSSDTPITARPTPSRRSEAMPDIRLATCGRPGWDVRFLVIPLNIIVFIDLDYLLTARSTGAFLRHSRAAAARMLCL